MTVWLVLTRCSHYEGEPLGIFSSEELANAFVATRPRVGPLNVWAYEVDEKVPE